MECNSENISNVDGVHLEGKYLSLLLETEMFDFL